MKIDLTSMLTYYINMAEDVEKDKATSDLLEDLGFKNFIRKPGFKAKHYTIGCGLAHQNILNTRCLKKAPFLVVEDDIAVRNFRNIIEVPDDADAVYLGLSKVGNINDKDKEEIYANKVDGFEDVYQIYNMLASHAILYINPGYARSAAQASEKYTKQKKGHDLGLAHNMRYWKVYAIEEPIFYQQGKYENHTNKTMSELNLVNYII